VIWEYGLNYSDSVYIDTDTDIDIFVDCIWVDARWQ